MVTNYCTEDGYLTEQYMQYHEAKAKGGWGLIITENYAINPTAKGYNRIPGLFEDAQIEKNREFVERLHQYGTKVFCQIYHPGKQSTTQAAGVQPLAPSVIPCPACREYPREITIEEIHQIEKDFASTAKRVKEAGFDGVEIHCGHGYLLAEFLSTYINHRSDEYGGCLANRVRIVKETYDLVREAVGEDFPISIRFSSFEDVPGGRDIAETRVLAKLFEDWGVDVINLSNGLYGSHGRVTIASYNQKHALGVDYAKEVKDIVDIPVITVNRINDPLMADGILVQGKADFVAMGRGSLTDPELPNKAMNGQADKIRYCIGCLQGCQNGLFICGQTTCLVNPGLGHEYREDLSPVKEPKRIAVIGAGPAGLETAIYAAARGHHVDLFEAKDRIGGQFVAASYGPNKGEFNTFLSWCGWQLKEKKVKVRLNTAATVEMIKEGNYDEVVVAAGGNPIVPPIPGIDLPNVKIAEDVLVGKSQAGNANLVAGGGEVGCETAAHLGVLDRNPVVIEMKDQILSDLIGGPHNELLDILDAYRVPVYTKTKLVEIKENCAVVEDESGKQREIPCDTVILALGYRPNTELADALENEGIRVHRLAGVLKTSDAMQATKEGYELGLKL